MSWANYYGWQTSCQSKYMSLMKTKTNWYWNQTQQQQIIFVPICKIVHLCIEVIVVKGVQDIPKKISIQSKHDNICIDVLNASMTHTISILSVEFCVETKLSTKVILILNTLLIRFYVIILTEIY